MSAAPNDIIGGDSGFRCSCGLCIPNFDNVPSDPAPSQTDVTRAQRLAQVVATRAMSPFDLQFLAAVASE